jgi:hypothetical protein
MQVAETLRNRKKNFSIALWIKYGLNIFVIQQFCSQVLRSLFKKDTGKGLRTVCSFKEKIYRYYCDPAIRLKGQVTKIE